MAEKIRCSEVQWSHLSHRIAQNKHPRGRLVWPLAQLAHTSDTRERLAVGHLTPRCTRTRAWPHLSKTSERDLGMVQIQSEPTLRDPLGARQVYCSHTLCTTCSTGCKYAVGTYSSPSVSGRLVRRRFLHACRKSVTDCHRVVTPPGKES